MRFQRNNGKARCAIRGLVPLMLCAAAALVPGNIRAQSDSGWLVKPSLLTALAYDDNIFFTRAEDPLDDYVLRVSPAIEAGYRSEPTAFNAYYTQDALRYDAYPQLDNDRARRHAELNFSHASTPRLSLFADAGYTETEAPGELDPRIGLELGRIRAERFYFNPAVVYQFDRLTTGSASYTFNRERAEGVIGGESHILALRRDHMLNRRDTFNLGYRAERFEFEDGSVVDMHVLFAGITRRFTPQTTFALLVGPRFEADGENGTEAEVAAELTHEFSRGDFNLTYARSRTPAIGLAGTAETESLFAALVCPLGNDIGLRVETGVIESALGGLETDAVVTDVEFAWRLGDYFSFIGAYEFNSQRGSLETPDFGEINRNVVWLGLVIAPPVRTDSAWWRRVRATSTVLDEPTLGRRESR